MWRVGCECARKECGRAADRQERRRQRMPCGSTRAMDGAERLRLDSFLNHRFHSLFPSPLSHPHTLPLAPARCGGPAGAPFACSIAGPADALYTLVHLRVTGM
jgi:hypothetical protein